MNGLGTYDSEISVTNTYTLVETNKVTVAVSPTNSGTVKGLKTGQVVDIGTSYPVTATPANGSYIFSQWTEGPGGTVLSSNPSFDYVDAADGLLTANFTANPFYESSFSGVYNALVTNADTLPENSGVITVTVNPSGTYSGKITLAGASHGFSGQLGFVSGNANATGKATVTVSKTESLDIELSFATTLTNSAPLTGTVTASDGTTVLWTSGIEGDQPGVDADIPAGSYNAYIAPGGDSSQPGGNSFLTAKVAKSGAVSVVLNLADGTSPATSFSTSMTPNGYCGVYASLYGGKGVIIGLLQFDASSGVPLLTAYGNLTWVKLPVANKFYTNGFTNTITAFTGGLYESLNIFDWTAGIFTLDGKDTAVTFSPVKNTFKGAAITLTPSTGAFKNSSGTTFKGVVISDNVPTAAGGDAGYGFSVTAPTAKDAGTTGPVQINATPAVVGGGDEVSGVVDQELSGGFSMTWQPGTSITLPVNVTPASQ